MPHLGSFTYASLPLATSWSGFTAFASDIGIAPGMLLISDGTRWMPFGVQTLARSNAAVSCPADATEDTLATIVVPANLMGINGGLRVYSRWVFTGSTNFKAFKVRLGGTIMMQPSTVTAAFTTASMETVIRNVASASSQIGESDALGIGTGTTSSTGAVDTTAAQNLTITGQKATAGETLTLSGYSVMVMP